MAACVGYNRREEDFLPHFLGQLFDDLKDRLDCHQDRIDDQ